MADRNDPSQYPTDQTNDNDVSFYGNSTMNDHQIQSHPEGQYAASDEMVGYYENVGSGVTHMTGNPGDYKTGVRERAFVARARQLPGATGIVTTTPKDIAGWSLNNPDQNNPARIRFRDGMDLGNVAVVDITLAANESTRDFLPLPIEITRAIFLEVVTGTVTGQLYTREVVNV